MEFPLLPCWRWRRLRTRSHRRETWRSATSLHRRIAGNAMLSIRAVRAAGRTRRRFPDIAGRPTTNAAALMAVMSKPHLDMLYMPQPQPDAAALAAYILSLRRR